MKTNTMQFKIFEDGSLQCIHNDRLNPIYNAIGDFEVSRASDVEWETVRKSSGWSVRSHANPQRALRFVGGRVKVSTRGRLKLFKTREAAIKSELANFWDLIKGAK